MSVHGAWLEQRGTEVILPAQSDAMQDSCCLDPLYDALPYATVLVAWDGTIDAINAAARDLAHIPTMAGLQAGKNVYDVLAMLQNPEAGILAEALRCILRGESQNFTRQALISEKAPTTAATDSFSPYNDIAFQFHFAAIAASEKCQLVDGKCLITIAPISHSRTMHSRIHDYIGKVLMLADTIPSLVSYFDTAQRYIFANQRYEDWFAIPPEAMIGKHISDVFGHKTYKTMKPHLERAVQGERVTYEGVLEDAPGGARWFRATHVPHKDAANAVIGVCSLVYDITPMKRQQEKLQRTIAAAEESNRAKSDFLASTSHELRTPLNAIIGFSEILMQEVFGSVGGAQNKEYIADIHGAANHLLGVINNILDLAKVESGKLALNDQRISMHQIVHSSMRMVEQRAAEKHLHLTRDEKASFPDVFVDDRLIRQVLTNVLVNAVKFTPDGGHVSVSGALQDDGALVVSVVDTGIGIAEADLLSVLEPFVQSDHAGVAVERGTGLGLPLAVSFMRLHGGLLRLDSVKGTGTTVEIVIPSQRVLAVSSGQ